MNGKAFVVFSGYYKTHKKHKKDFPIFIQHE